MENERPSMNKEQRAELNVEERLAAFYGPPLPEQPLSAEAWMRVHSKLSTRSLSSRQLIRRALRRRYGEQQSHSIPPFIEDAFAALVYEAHLPQSHFPASILRCSLNGQRRTPRVRVSPLSRHKITLILPVRQARSLEPPELDVLVATGLARLQWMRESHYVLRRMLLLSIEPLALLLFVVLWFRGLSIYILPIAITLLMLIGLGIVWSLQASKRDIAMRADVSMVQWIGRSRACSGLHLLAERARTVRRSRWGEPTLEERIARVCGTRVTVEHERLTLAR